MAEYVPIGPESPRLEGVLGAMAPLEEQDLRRRVLAANERLVELARSLGTRVGGHDRGLELALLPSGQLSITAAIETGDGDHNAIAFFIELRPGWYFGQLEESPSWVVETSVEVDCLHSVDHEAMERVYESELVAHSPHEAVEALEQQVGHLTELVTKHPPEYWTAQARD